MVFEFKDLFIHFGLFSRKELAFMKQEGN
jgi:hypothetical protein